jgi:biotin carboxyl carrier protein
MRDVRAAVLAAMATFGLLGVAASAVALPGVPGGVQAPSASHAAGAAPGRAAHPLPHPVLGGFSVPRTAGAGRPPRVTLRINEAGVASVDVRVILRALTKPADLLVASLGWVRTGRTLSVTWPSGATLAPGGYVVTVSAHDHRGASLLPGARISDKATLSITAPAAPAPAAATPTATPPAAPATEVGVPTPAQTVADGAIFPVAGAHNFGGPENLFGAPREGYLHQGQDILTAEGTLVVASLPGTILTTSYQEGGAGYYAVEQTTVGFDFMFAHCQATSLAVSVGAAVLAGQTVCRAGQTGDATTPHLDFEIWVGGWQVAPGRPIDPLPYLEAWEQAA